MLLCTSLFSSLLSESLHGTNFVNLFSGIIETCSTTGFKQILPAFIKLIDDSLTVVLIRTDGTGTCVCPFELMIRLDDYWSKLWDHRHYWKSCWLYQRLLDFYRTWWNTWCYWILKRFNQLNNSINITAYIIWIFNLYNFIQSFIIHWRWV